MELFLQLPLCCSAQKEAGKRLSLWGESEELATSLHQQKSFHAMKCA